VINESPNRRDAIVLIIQAAKISGGITLTKIREKTDMIIPSHQLKEFVPSLDKNGLIAFQNGEQVDRTSYKGMHFLQTYIYTIGLMNRVEQ
jgi:hypothetical protein